MSTESKLKDFIQSSAGLWGDGYCFLIAKETTKAPEFTGYWPQ